MLCVSTFQDLVEKVVVLRRAVEQTQRSGPAAIGILLAEKMSQYANLLASQGSLSTAITYLPDNTNQVCHSGCVSSICSLSLEWSEHKDADKHLFISVTVSQTNSFFADTLNVTHQISTLT